VTIAGISSTRVFHSEQSTHCPCQRDETDPQDWQTKRFWILAMGVPGSRREHRRLSYRENNWRTIPHFAILSQP
jgi:hypothetical protein